MTTQLKPLVIYHGNCADGFSAAWVFYHHKPGGYDFHAGVYGQLPPDVTGRDVFLVDFSYPRNTVAALLMQAKSVTLIDHHKTAIDELKDMPLLKQHVNLDMSGATLAWQYLCGDDMQRPLLLGHIEDRDLWRFKLPLTKEINSAVFSMEYTFANWDNLMASNAAELVQLSVGGAAIARKQAKDIKELLGATARYMQINGETVPVACMPHTMASEAGEALCRLQPNAELENVWAACYYDTAEHRIFSCRSLENGADVSAIAAIYGGGGHKHAAGFRVSRLHALATQ